MKFYFTLSVMALSTFCVLAALYAQGESEPGSECRDSGSFGCLSQAPLMCEYQRGNHPQGFCNGTCDVCYGAEVPERMCFVASPGKTCPNKVYFSCGPGQTGNCLPSDAPLPGEPEPPKCKCRWTPNSPPTDCGMSSCS